MIKAKIRDYEKHPIPSPMASYGAKIDQLVYKLCLPAPRASRQAGGLTKEEIKIVEDVHK